MAVSQPRPPDRVDAALEKVAPLRYLEAHEYARERVLTRYYRHYLSYNSFLSFKRLFQHAIEEFDVISDNTIRYVWFISDLGPNSVARFLISTEPDK